jgi:hypothetical protein
MQISLTLTEPQEEFVFTDQPHPAFVAGYGAGKSQAAVGRILIKALQYSGMNFGFVEPTYDLVKLIAWPRFTGMLDEWGMEYELNKADSILKIFNGSQIIFRSADNPERMVGFEIADGVIDEIDTLKRQQAADVWTKMLARCRQKKADGSDNTLAAASTPEGFNFVYDTWGKSPREGYQLIKAPTSSNPYLPKNYIESLKRQYSSAQLSAYLDGEFVNLTSGSVYPEFDRNLNCTFERINAGEPLHIGIDFNVNNMSAVVCVIRNGNPMALDEITGVRDTPTMILRLQEHFRGHPITVYPDASGGATKSINASLSDITLLRAANFTVLANSKNPAVKDRVMALNQMIHNQGDRRLLVNPDTCPNMVEGLERQSYGKNGEPDKTAGFDHLNDALGYFIAYKYAIGRGTVSFAQIAGV